nr:hypothetical protein [Colwellia marinimaniae]
MKAKIGRAYILWSVSAVTFLAFNLYRLAATSSKVLDSNFFCSAALSFLCSLGAIALVNNFLASARFSLASASAVSG